MNKTKTNHSGYIKNKFILLVFLFPFVFNIFCIFWRAFLYHSLLSILKDIILTEKEFSSVFLASARFGKFAKKIAAPRY